MRGRLTQLSPFQSRDVTFCDTAHIMVTFSNLLCSRYFSSGFLNVKVLWWGPAKFLRSDKIAETAGSFSNAISHRFWFLNRREWVMWIMSPPVGTRQKFLYVMVCVWHRYLRFHQHGTPMFWQIVCHSACFNCVDAWVFRGSLIRGPMAWTSGNRIADTYITYVYFLIAK